jgi:hypothetical protein
MNSSTHNLIFGLESKLVAQEIRRAFTVFQLMTILEEAAVLLHSPGTDTSWRI